MSRRASSFATGSRPKPISFRVERAFPAETPARPRAVVVRAPAPGASEADGSVPQVINEFLPAERSQPDEQRAQ